MGTPKGTIPWNKGISGTIEKNCLTCQKDFSVTKWNNKRRFCSHVCYWKKLKGRPSIRDRRIEKKCLYCGKLFLCKRSLLRVNYCSISCCKKDWWSKNKEKHPSWKGGITPLHEKIRKSDEYLEWRNAVIKRDNYRCVKCGVVQTQKRKMIVDHIKSFSLYPKLRLIISNGRTLCIPCDKLFGWKWNKGKKYWGKNSIKNVK